jgi:hypothetical protein
MLNKNVCSIYAWNIEHDDKEVKLVTFSGSFIILNHTRHNESELLKSWLRSYLFFCGLYYKPITIVNDDSRVVNKLETSVADDARVIIYDRHMFIVQATGFSCQLFSLYNHG